MTACPGCMINLTDHLLRHGMPQKVYHVLELLDTETPMTGGYAA